MAKLSSLVNLSTAGKIAGGVVLGGISTVAVQRYTDSSEFSKDPQRAEMREEQKKKLDFEVQQRSEELEKKERELKMLEATLAKQQATLTEERLAVQQMKAAATEVATSGVAVVETVQPVAQTEDPADVQPEKPKADVVSADNAPKRPAVFDGGGRKETAPTAKDAQKKPSVVFGSSGDVVTIEKDGASDAETERLRKEVENLRRRLAEERLRERERAFSEEMRWKRNVESKATQTDDPLFEAAFGGNDPFDKPGSKKVKKSDLKKKYPSNLATAAKSTSEEDRFSKMSKEEVKDYARGEIELATDAIDSKILEKITGKRAGTADAQQAVVTRFKDNINAALGDQSKDISDFSINQVLEGHPNRSDYEKQIEKLREEVPLAKDIKTVSALNAVATAVRNNLEPKRISPEIYAKLLMESTDKVADNLKKLPEKPEKSVKNIKTGLKEVLERRDMLRKNVDEILKKEPTPMGVTGGLQKLADAKAKAGDIVKSLYKNGGKGLLKGFEEIQKDWENVVNHSKALYSSGLPPPPAVPPALGVDEIAVKSDGLPYNWANDLRAVDEDFRKQDDANSTAYDEAVKPYCKALAEAGSCDTRAKTIDKDIDTANKKLRRARKERDNEKVTELSDFIAKKKDEKREIIKQKTELRKEVAKLKGEVEPIMKKWKDYRKDAYSKPEKKLLVIQKQWLDYGLNDQSKIDDNVQKSKNELSNDSKRLPASEVKRLEKLGLNVDNSVPPLTEEEKKDRKQFIEEVKTCEKRSEDLKNRYRTAVRKKEALEKIEVQPVVPAKQRYRVRLQQLSVFGSRDVCDCLTSIAPYIEELTIEDFDNESAGTPFFNFAKLCRRCETLKKLSLKGIFGASFEEKKSGKLFFDALGNIEIPDEFEKAKLGLNGVTRFFDVIALIPNLKTFEMYSMDCDGASNEVDAEINEAKRVYAAVESCEEVHLPNLKNEAKIEFFDCLTYAETSVKKHLKLYTNSFGGMMRTEGFPEALYRLLESKRATVEWLGNLVVGKFTPYSDDDKGKVAIPDGGSNTVEKIRKTFEDQEVDGKHLGDWVSDTHFSENFLDNPGVYLKLCATHSEAFRKMLIEYNEKELNPLYIACKKLEALKKIQTQTVAFENVVPNDPLAEILREYPVLNGKSVAFDGIRPMVDGSTLRKITLPALLNLVLRQRINGKSHIVLAVEDGEQDTEEYTDEKTGETLRRKLEGQFSHTGFWYFPSTANTLWEKERFTISASGKTFTDLSKNEKEDLKVKMMEESQNLQNHIDAQFYEIVECRLDPKVGKECLAGVDPKSIFYWNYFSQRMQTGGLIVATDAPENERTLFEIFSKAASAQSDHEALYAAFEEMYAQNQKLQPLRRKINELKEKIAELEASDEEEGRLKGEKENLLKKEEEAKEVTEMLEKYRAEMDAHANLLSGTCVFLKAKLPELKKIAKNIDGFGGNKKPAPGSNPTNTNATTNVNPTVTTTTPNPVVPKKVASLFGINNSAADVNDWITKGRKVKYKAIGTAKILDVLPSTHVVRLAFVGVTLSVGKAPDSKDVEKAVKGNFLEVQNDGADCYVVVPTWDTKAAVPVP